MATLIVERSTYWVESGGSNPEAIGDYRYYWQIYYEQTSTDKQNNRSKVIVKYYLQKHKSQGTSLEFGYPSGTSTAYINGNSIGSITTSSGSIPTGTSWALTYIGERSTYVSHNQDGTGSFTFRANGFGLGVAQRTYSLPTIPRNSIIGELPESFTLDLSVLVPITRYVDTYYDKLDIYQTVNGSSTLIKTITDITSSCIVSFTSAELDTLYSNTPLSDAYTTLTFTLSTYSDSSYTTQVGSSSSKTIKGNLVLDTPTFSGFTYADSNATTRTLTGNSLKIVKGKSTLKITLTNAQKAIANTRGTSISHYIVNNKTVAKATIEGTSGYSISNYPYDNVNVYAVDTRGVSSNQVTYSFAANNVFVDYQDVSKNTEQSYTRSDNGIGKFVYVSFSGTWWNGNFGATTNTLYATYKYKKSTESTYTDGPEDLTLTTNGNNFSYIGQIKGDQNNQYGFDVSETYDIIITVKDVNRTTPLSSDTITFNVHSGEPAIAIYKNKVALGAKYDETLGGTQFWGNTYLNGGLLIDIDTIYPVGSIYMTTNALVDPNNLFSGTTWQQIEDTFLLAAGNTYTNGDTGGSATVTLTTNEIPTHEHYNAQNNSAGGSGKDFTVDSGINTRLTTAGNYWWTKTTQTGGGQAHDNMPPYLVVCMWERIS